MKIKFDVIESMSLIIALNAALLLGMSTAIAGEREFASNIEKTRANTHKLTQDCLQMMRESRDQGVVTFNELDRQGDVLRGSLYELSTINQDLQQCEHIITGMESWWGAICNAASRFFGINQPPAKKQAPAPKVKALLALSNHHDGIVQPQTELGETEDHIEQDLDDMISGIQDLKKIALAMGCELEQQDKVIDRAIRRTDNVHDRLKKNEGAVNRLLGK